MGTNRILPIVTNVGEYVKVGHRTRVLKLECSAATAKVTKCGSGSISMTSAPACPPSYRTDVLVYSRRRTGPHGFFGSGLTTGVSSAFPHSDQLL